MFTRWLEKYGQTRTIIFLSLMIGLVSQAVTADLRSGDVFGRFGGDEFILIHFNPITAFAVQTLADRKYFNFSYG